MISNKNLGKFLVCSVNYFLDLSWKSNVSNELSSSNCYLTFALTIYYIYILDIFSYIPYLYTYIPLDYIRTILPTYTYSCIYAAYIPVPVPQNFGAQLSLLITLTTHTNYLIDFQRHYLSFQGCKFPQFCRVFAHSGTHPLHPYFQTTIVGTCWTITTFPSPTKTFSAPTIIWTLDTLVDLML